MARARNIKPSFFTNEDLAELPFATRLLFIGLWTLADREGRLEDRPKKVKMAVFPGDSVDVDRGLEELHQRRFILRYQVEGAAFIQILAFEKHQNPHHREPASTIPKPEAQPPMQPGLNLGLGGDGRQAEPGASPGLAVLIPDSPSLIPDSGEKPAPDAARRGPSKPVRIDFDWQAKAFSGITEADTLRWQSAYPAIAVPVEIEKAAAWMGANPANRKQNYERYLVNWFGRAQQSAGRVRQAGGR